MGHQSRRRAFLMLTLLLMAALPGAVSPAAAQVLGVFRWQMQPYCNVVTFTVIQQGPAYQLTGNDDLCGSGAVAPATGTASANPSGSIALGFSIVTPSGATAHVNATVTLPAVNGTWTDADGNGGPFVFNGPGGTTPLRPAPTRSTLITSSQLAASIFAGSGAATTIARSDHLHDDRYYTESETVAIVAAAGAVAIDAGGYTPPNYTPQSTFLNIPFNTPRAGRLLITMPVNFSAFSCSAGSSAIVMLVLDDTPIVTSIQVTSLSQPHLGTMTGLVTTSVPAGSHTVGVGIRCSTGTPGGLVAYAPRAHVLVFP
jgi:hypothetical protein